MSTSALLESPSPVVGTSTLHPKHEEVRRIGPRELTLDSEQLRQVFSKIAHASRSVRIRVHHNPEDEGDTGSSLHRAYRHLLESRCHSVTLAYSTPNEERLDTFTRSPHGIRHLRISKPSFEL